MLKKGIILAGGLGTRLYPATIALSKQLLPLYNKPMIYYSLSTLMLMGIREVLIITRPDESNLFKKLLGDGENFGIDITYQEQEKPAGLAQALIIGEEFLAGDDFAFILGDNFFYSDGLSAVLKRAAEKVDGATVFAYYVTNPSDYGVVGFNSAGKVTSIEEKPKSPASHYAVTGLYLYSNEAVDVAKNVKPSKRGEVEITSVNQHFLEEGKLSVELLGRGVAWMDTGTCQGMLEASNFVYSIEKRQSLLISCPEEIAYRKGWIDEAQLTALAKKMSKTDYGKYLQKLLTSDDYFSFSA